MNKYREIWESNFKEIKDRIKFIKLVFKPLELLPLLTVPLGSSKKDCFDTTLLVFLLLVSPLLLRVLMYLPLNNFNILQGSRLESQCPPSYEFSLLTSKLLASTIPQMLMTAGMVFVPDPLHSPNQISESQVEPTPHLPLPTHPI